MPDNGQDRQLHPMSVQTRRKTVHNHQRIEPRGAPTNGNTTPESPGLDHMQQNRHLEVTSCAGNGNGATPSPQKRANNR